MRPRRIIVTLLGVLALAACGKGNGGSHSAAPIVQAIVVEPQRFVDRVEAVGTAFAREQVTLAAPVTQRITRIDFTDGQRVAKGQVIAVLAADQQAATLAEASARAREAEQQLARLRALKARGFATVASIDAQIAAAGSARAQAAEARATIADRIVRAPFSGYATLRQISPGAVVQAGTEIATIADDSEIKLDFDVPETMLTAVKEGQSITAEAAAYPGEPFTGRIATINPVVDSRTRSIKVRAILPNPDRRLKSGMLMQVGVETAPRMALAVPELSVVSEGDQRYVFVVGPDNKVKRTKVVTGTRQNGFMEVREGLSRRDRVVSEGVVKLADGMTVQLAAPPGKGNPGATAPKAAP